MKEEKPNYYAIIPADIRYDNDLKPNEKLLYGEITALSNKTGECVASNKYFSELYDVSQRAVAIWINHLKEKKYILVGYVKKGNEIEKRTIKLGGENNFSGVANENSSPILINNNKEKELYSNKLEYSKKKKKSIINIPSISEIEDYCVNVRHNNIDFKYFYDFYNEANWIDSNGKQIKNWKQKIIQWEHHNKDTKVVPEYERF